MTTHNYPSGKADTGKGSPFGRQLKHWRSLRRLSQLELACEAEVSARHISFLENGRSRPSQDMVLRLAEALDLTLRDANALLQAAGFAPAYPARHLSDKLLAPFRQVVEQMLRSHLPYPGFVIDRLWNVVDANATAKAVLPGLSSVSPESPVHGIDLFYKPGPIRDTIANWDEVARGGWARLRREVLHAPDDLELRALLERLESYVSEVDLRPEGVDLDDPVLRSRIRVGDQEISTFGTIVTFTSARDVTIDELRLELLFPADAASAAFFAQLGQMLGLS